MSAVEQDVLSYVRRRHADGALATTEKEIMGAIVPADQPKLWFKPAYKYAIQRLRVRGELNAVTDGSGTTHYFIGNVPSRELRESLGLSHDRP